MRRRFSASIRDAVLFDWIVDTGIGCYLYFSPLSKLPVQTVSVCGYLEPLSAVGFAAILPGERMTALQIIGAACIIGGAVLLTNASATFRRKDHAEFFGRRIDERIVRNAATVFMMYLVLFLASGMLISHLDGLPIHNCLFETASAIATVGLSLGVTTKTGVLSKCVLMFLMFFGRVGALTLVYAAVPGTPKTISRLPKETISVG